ncbi:MAG: hypothetical protein ACLTZH_05570 [Subdoligranulum sp.]
MNFITKAPVMLCGGDYNPDQWLDRPDILESGHPHDEKGRNEQRYAGCVCLGSI